MRTYEEMVDQAIFNNYPEKNSVMLNTNLSEDFTSIYNNLTSKNDTVVSNTVSDLIGVPLRSSAMIAFKLKQPFEFGYYHNYSIYALAQNPVFPSVDVEMSVAHNFWYRHILNFSKDFELEIVPVVGFKKNITERKQTGDLISNGLDLDIAGQNSNFFNSLNFNFKYRFTLFDLELENYNYFLDSNDKYSSYIKVNSFLNLLNNQFEFHGRYRIAQAFYTTENKKVDLGINWKWLTHLSIGLNLSEMSFVNPHIKISYAGLDINFSYVKYSLDEFQEQIARNYMFTLSYNF